MDFPRLRRRLRETGSGRALLRTLSWLFGAVVWVRDLLYRFRLLPSKRLGVRTICVGNLTTGGTGKTSAVLLAAQTFHRKQIKTAILSRGYKRTRKTKDVQVLLHSQNVSWQDTGDEPWMMHRALKGMEVPILVSPDRSRAAETAVFYYNPQVLLLDDGFQHRRLGRDLDIVLVNALDPFGGGSLLPYGDLREPLSALRRAGLVVITHADQVSKERVEEIRGVLGSSAPDVPLIEAAHRADFLFDLKGDKRRRLAYIRGKPIACFSAIGDPGSFEGLLRNIGARLVQVWRYPDHHAFTLEEVQAIENVRAGMTVVTTFKDFPRLPAGWQEVLTGEVLSLGVRMEITKGKPVWEAALTDELAGVDG